MEELKTKIENVIHRINGELAAGDNKSISLMMGLPGIVIFRAAYAELTGLGMQEVEELTNEMISYVNTTEDALTTTYCDGLVGFLAFCDHMEQRTGKVYFDYDADTTEYLGERMQVYFDNNEPDFLHGSLGIMHYFVGRYRNSGFEAEKIQLERIIGHGMDMLDRLALKDEQGYRWDHPVYNDQRFKGKPFFNMGLAHGLPGILSILAEVTRFIPNLPKARLMTRETYKFINSIKSSGLGELSLFQTYHAPHYPLPYDSRLAWCYGDVGIALAILKAGRALDDHAMISDGLAVALETTKRRSEDDTLLMDAEFCHGTCGIAHMYGIMYELTKNEVFYEAKMHWIRETIAYAGHPDGLAGFRTHIKDDEWGTDDGLLRGIAGIGLVLISYLTGERDWDRLFLLD